MMYNQRFLKLSSLKVVFSNPLYITIAVLVTAAFWIIFNVLDQLIFFYPILIFYLPDDAITGFVLTNVSSILLGILISMNLFIEAFQNEGRQIPFFGSGIKCYIKCLCQLLSYWFSYHFYTWSYWDNCDKFPYQLSSTSPPDIHWNSCVCPLYHN